ncbi:MAG: hypothetical protein U0T83_06290 [Bacteriovoracaceae bacterium]
MKVVEDPKCLCLKNNSCKKFKLPKFDLSYMPKDMQEKFNKNLLIYQKITNAVYTNQEDVIEKEMVNIPQMQKELAEMNKELLNAYNKKRIKNGEKPIDFKNEQDAINKKLEAYSTKTLAQKSDIKNTNDLLMPSKVVADPHDPWVVINNLKKRLKKNGEAAIVAQPVGTEIAAKPIEKNEKMDDFEEGEFVHRKDAGSIFKIISNKYMHIYSE